MKLIMSVSMIILLLSSKIMFLASMISKEMFMDREKLSPFECGFDPKSSARLPFSLQFFFLIAMIFSIFDVEITLLLPFIILTKLSNPFNLTMIFILFLTILLMGLYYEWNQGSLNSTL